MTIEWTSLLWMPRDISALGYNNEDVLSISSTLPEKPLFFPDGSAQWESSSAADAIFDFLRLRGMLDSEVVTTRFRAVSAFPMRGYILFYPRKYQDAVGRLEFTPGLRVAQPPLVDEMNAENLQLSVEFKRCPSLRAREQFVALCDKWFTSTSDVGIFDDGPLRLMKAVEFSRKSGILEIDASLTGQDTLNWFMLSVLSFSVATSVIVTSVLPAIGRT